MLRHVYDPKLAREFGNEGRLPLVGVLICIAILGLYLWRLQHFERTVATIKAVGEEDVHRRGVKTVTMAELFFSKSTPSGEAVECRHAFEIGTPRDGFNVGDRLDIVPATGTCQRADIIGKSKPDL